MVLLIWVMIIFYSLLMVVGIVEMAQQGFSATPFVSFCFIAVTLYILCEIATKGQFIL